MKTIKVPLKETWKTKDYIECLRGADRYNQVTREYHKITCSFCPREIETETINVVDFGTKVSCPNCFNARYRKRRQIYKHIPVPPDLHPQGAVDADPLDVEKRRKAAVDKAVEIQNDNITQIRNAFAKD
jgi:hypothetical protein